MSRVRIGELLGRMGKLSGHDIDEILQEQSANGHRFGDIALTWGMVQPEHLWLAWCSQLQEGADRVDLDSLGVDAQVVERVPAELARRLHAMPIRLTKDQLIFAISDPAQAPLLHAYEATFGAHVRFVLADADKIEKAIERYYPLDLAVA
jgi:general secretion pathway protein E/type IV pilus assembly protein PilB